VRQIFCQSFNFVLFCRGQQKKPRTRKEDGEQEVMKICATPLFNVPKMHVKDKPTQIS
jgi:hypothetical protein